MKNVICYPVPLGTPKLVKTFTPFFKRFCDSMRKYDPGADYELAVIVSRGTQQDIEEVKKLFYDLPAKFYYHDGIGWDIEVSLWYARTQATEPCFLIHTTSRVYAYRAGWLKRLVETREKYGNGLYGTTVNRERKFHCPTHCYGVDSEQYKKYPHQVHTRADTYDFEAGERCYLEWYQAQKLPCWVVYWDEALEMTSEPGAPCLNRPNVFRSGDQSQILVKDKHSDIYENAGLLHKLFLQVLAFKWDLLRQVTRKS